MLWHKTLIKVIFFGLFFKTVNFKALDKNKGYPQALKIMKRRHKNKAKNLNHLGLLEFKLDQNYIQFNQMVKALSY